MAISRAVTEQTSQVTQGRPASPVEAFRGRLVQLIRTRFDGRYSVLAHRAGIPVSTMEHYIHRAKHMPGAEHVGHMADALGVTTDLLIHGRTSLLPQDLMAHPVVLEQNQMGEADGLERQIAIPVFDCTCPSPDCVFWRDPLPIGSTRMRVMVPADLLPIWYRLVGLRIAEPLGSFGWKVGTRLVLDWSGRSPTFCGEWYLFKLDGRCHLGRIHQSPEGLMVILPPDTSQESEISTTGLRTLPPEQVEVLGKVVAVVGAP